MKLALFVSFPMLKIWKVGPKGQQLMKLWVSAAEEDIQGILIWATSSINYLNCLGYVAWQQSRLDAAYFKWMFRWVQSKVWRIGYISEGVV